jgi:hypothetical protein
MICPLFANKNHLVFIVVVLMSSNINLLMLTLIFFVVIQEPWACVVPMWSTMDNLLSSPPSSFFLPMHVEQEALHSIQQEANDNYNEFIASRDRNFEICMGKLHGVEMFWDINASVNNGEPFDDEKE